MTIAAHHILPNQAHLDVAALGISDLVQSAANNLITKMLTTEQFANEMNVTRETVQAWKRNGELVKGRHYVEIKSVVNFPWPMIVHRLMEDQLNLQDISIALANDKQGKAVAQKPKKQAQRRLSSVRTGINLDYGL